MQLPGTWLLALSRVVFDDDVQTRVVDQTIADMRAEWIAAAASPAGRLRARFDGYLAFWSLVAIAPFAFPAKTSWRPGMSRTATFRILAVLIAIGAATGWAVNQLQPQAFRSTAVLQLMRPRIPAALAADLGITSLDSLEERVRTVTQVVLSRTRLERMIREFNLYGVDRQTSIPAEMIDAMRRDIDIDVDEAARKSPAGQVRISFVASNPTTAMKMTERMAGYVIEESLKEGQRKAEGTSSYLEAQSKEFEEKLAALTADPTHSGARQSEPRRLEIEVTENLYKRILTQRAQADMMLNIEKRQIGEQFILLDAPRVAEHPIGATRFQSTVIGGLSGLVTAIVIIAAVQLRRLFISARRPVPASA